ncbi:hypothetical protein [Nevskia soli]|uniref:hypothetical protein n=1 Tax=Nevskia soli TaxID=418856 RepID=UPI0004A6CE1D|nr:hypothetical protein [Nevskia soli]
MAHISTIPFLFAAQCALLVAAGKSADSEAAGPKRAMLAAIVLVVPLVVWGFFSARFALTGVYASPEFLTFMPGLWLPAVPIVIATTLLLLIPAVRSGIHEIALNTPAHWQVAIQALRICAIGTLLLSLREGFPLHVELAIGVTDITFGLSAVLIYKAVKSGRISNDALMFWHMAGFLIIIVPGELAIQSGLPGPAQVFSHLPSSESMLTFPMVLAPSLVVPNFLLLNLLGVYSAYLNSTKGRNLVSAS